MIKLLCSILLVTFNTTTFGQGKILLQDDFKNNKKGWKLQHDSDFFVDIKRGVLHLEKLQKNFTRRGCLWYNKIIPGLNTLNDFSITIYAKFLSGGDISDMIDLQWGNRGTTVNRKLTSNLYQLNFFMRGEIRLDYFNYNWNYSVKKSINKLLEANDFNPNQVNKYELIQKDEFVIFSVNGKEVLKQLCNPIAGNSIGFQQCLKSAWEIDKIVIRQLTNKKSISTDTSRLITSVDKNNINYPSDKELKAYPNPFNNNLYVNIYLDKEETVQFNLSDINGMVLQQHTKKLQKGIQIIMLYADVIPGSYVLKVQIGNVKALTAIVIKQ
ncbi:MAG: hypothetical protein JWO92_591 [Chitinophagaceae bacterium]|nr:hypothetical protein [Chitinophagaceae bacterium]